MRFAMVVILATLVSMAFPAISHADGGEEIIAYITHLEVTPPEVLDQLLMAFSKSVVMKTDFELLVREWQMPEKERERILAAVRNRHFVTKERLEEVGVPGDLFQKILTEKIDQRAYTVEYVIDGKCGEDISCLERRGKIHHVHRGSGAKLRAHTFFAVKDDARFTLLHITAHDDIYVFREALEPRTEPKPVRPVKAEPTEPPKAAPGAPAVKQEVASPTTQPAPASPQAAAGAEKQQIQSPVPQPAVAAVAERRCPENLFCSEIHFWSGGGALQLFPMRGQQSRDRGSLLIAAERQGTQRRYPGTFRFLVEFQNLGGALWPGTGVLINGQPPKPEDFLDQNRIWVEVRDGFGVIAVPAHWITPATTRRIYHGLNLHYPRGAYLKACSGEEITHREKGCSPSEEMEFWGCEGIGELYCHAKRDGFTRSHFVTNAR